MLLLSLKGDPVRRPVTPPKELVRNSTRGPAGGLMHAPPTSKGKAGLELDAPVVGDASSASAATAGGATAEAGVNACGLAELRRAEVADKSAWIVMVQHVGVHHREGHFVTTFGGTGGAPAAASAAATHAHAATAAATPAAAAHATASAAAAHATTAAPGSAAAIAAGSQGVGARAAPRAEAKGPRHTQVEGDQAGAGQVVARHEVIGDAGRWIDAEIALRRQHRIGARRCGESGPGVLQGVARIGRRAGHVEGAVVLVVAEERDILAEARVEVRHQDVLVHVAARFV